MFKSIGFASKSFVVLGAAVIGLVFCSLFAPAAHAAPIQTEGTWGCSLKAGDKEIVFTAGTRIVVTLTDGTKRTFRCDGNTGEWVEETIKVGGTVVGGGFSSTTLALGTRVSGSLSFKAVTSKVAASTIPSR